ncbi:uncharacterized protein Fot_16248 [Forsythia ovata]|uniref:Uncharacterized protein n=1 Tax=Forsythia ovata TaxID=205694 RepID=A0ABD1WC19_9LAMI
MIVDLQVRMPSMFPHFEVYNNQENVLIKYCGILISRKSRHFESYLAAGHDNGYNITELLVELEVLTLCNMDLIIHVLEYFIFTLSGRLLWSPSILGLDLQSLFMDASAISVMWMEKGMIVLVQIQSVALMSLPHLGITQIGPALTRRLNHHREPLVRRTADAWEYAFQILFQICAGAVTLTDCVFWLIIYPFLTGKDYRLHFLVVCMHSINAVFLLGETFLNCLRFPFFRIAYFVLWTCVFVIFQWIIHACVSMWWPYSFLDLSSPYAPIWYLGVGLLHLPCFAIFTLIFRIKQFCLSR